jgi:hypothetical protein
MADTNADGVYAIGKSGGMWGVADSDDLRNEYTPRAFRAREHLARTSALALPLQATGQFELLAATQGHAVSSVMCALKTLFICW